MFEFSIFLPLFSIEMYQKERKGKLLNNRKTFLRETCPTRRETKTQPWNKSSQMFPERNIAPIRFSSAIWRFSSPHFYPLATTIPLQIGSSWTLFVARESKEKKEEKKKQKGEYRDTKWDIDAGGGLANKRVGAEWKREEETERKRKKGKGHDGCPCLNIHFAFVQWNLLPIIPLYVFPARHRSS